MGHAVGTAVAVGQHTGEVAADAAAAGCNLDLVAAAEHMADRFVLVAAVVPSLADY